MEMGRTLRKMTMNLKCCQILLGTRKTQSKLFKKKKKNDERQNTKAKLL